ncbi:hypothetical protein GCM10023310_69440 [Paenibacillus vulneris]
MACVTWSKPTTNIQNDKELYDMLVEINSKSTNELYIMYHFEFDKRLFSSPRKIEWYSIYWNLSNGEYQSIMSLEFLDRQDIFCYLLGILTGMDKATNC